MATYAQLRSRVDALMRKHATELKLYRLRPVAVDFCDEMAAAVTADKRPPAKPLTDWGLLLIRRIQDRGYRAGDLGILLRYLETCVKRRVLPQANDVLRAPVPQGRRARPDPAHPPGNPLLTPRPAGESVGGEPVATISGSQTRPRVGPHPCIRTRPSQTQPSSPLTVVEKAGGLPDNPT